MPEDTLVVGVTSNGAGSWGDTLIRLLWRSGTFLAGVVAIAVGVLYVKQESLLYFPTIGEVPRHTAQNPRRYRSPSEHKIPFETHMIKCEDGTTIHSWLLYHPENRSKKVPTILFFHGNAGNIGMRLPNAMQMYHYLKANIWLIEYRGYGDSDDATPNEAGLKMDSEAVWQYIHNPQSRYAQSVDPKRVFVFGRSLGGAVAFHLAQYSQTPTMSYPPLAGVIVENTFLSISEMVDHLMPYVAPLKALILRIGWNSGKIAPTLRIPTLFLAGARDTLVPHSHMLDLFERMVTSKVGNDLVRIHIVEDGTHNETWMQGGREYWLAIQRFIEEIFAEERPSGASYSRSGNSAGVVTRSGNKPFQRKHSTGLASTACSSLSGDCAADSVEVDMGFAGGDAADMISSVGDILGMAKEATRNVAGVTGMGGADAYKKKD